MSIREIKEAMVALNQSVPGIGQVWNRLRWLPVNASARDIEEVFGVADETTERGWSIRTWMWYRHGRPAKREDLGGTILSLTHHMVLQGYWEINDAYDSTTEWNVMCDVISRQFLGTDVLHEVAHAWTVPSIVVEQEIKAVGIYECHDVEMSMDVTELINTSDPAEGIILSPPVWHVWEG